MANKNKLKYKKAQVALELHFDYIKIACLFFSKEGNVFRLIKKRFSHEEDKDISAAIAELFKAEKIPTKNIYLNIPRHFVMARLLRLPSVDNEEIRNMVKMESARRMPYRDSDVVIGYRIIEKIKDGYSEVLLCIAEIGSIMSLIEILEKADLSIEKVALSSESLLSWYNFVQDRRGSKEEAKHNTVLIDMDSDYVDIDILEKAKLVFTRAFAYGKDASYVSKDAVEEIKKSIAAYQKERSSNIDEIFITGAGDQVKMIEPSLKKELEIPITMMDQVEGIKIDEGTSPDLDKASFAELIGLSLKAKEMKINLIPESMAEEGEIRLFKKNMLRTIVLSSLIIIFSLAVLMQKMFEKLRILSVFDSSIKAMEPRVARAKKMDEDLKFIKSHIEKRPFAIDVLTEVYKVTPPGITLNLLDYENSRSLILRGNASSLDEIIKFITILESSQYFENVKLKYTQKRSVAGKQITDFEIAAVLTDL